MRSPRIAPPVNGLDGSTATIATRSRVFRVLGREPRHEGALATTRRTGDADDARLSRVGVERPQDVGAPGLVILDDRQEPRDAAGVSRARPREQELERRRPPT